MPYKLPYWMGIKETHDQIYAAAQYLGFMASCIEDIKEARLLIAIAIDELDAEEEPENLTGKLEVLIREFASSFDSSQEVIDHCMDNLREILDYPPLA